MRKTAPTPTYLARTAAIFRARKRPNWHTQAIATHRPKRACSIHAAMEQLWSLGTQAVSEWCRYLTASAPESLAAGVLKLPRKRRREAPDATQVPTHTHVHLYTRGRYLRAGG